MAKKDYKGAIRSYGEAIEHDAGNAVYWSNRCARLSLPLACWCRSVGRCAWPTTLDHVLPRSTPLAHPRRPPAERPAEVNPQRQTITRADPPLPPPPTPLRAAAHSQLSAHEAAISDAKQALKIDPSFSKAYSRLGHAQYSSGQYRDAVSAYEKGLEMDPNVRPPSPLLPLTSRAKH